MSRTKLAITGLATLLSLAACSASPDGTDPATVSAQGSVEPAGIIHRNPPPLCGYLGLPSCGGSDPCLNGLKVVNGICQQAIGCPMDAVDYSTTSYTYQNWSGSWQGPVNTSSNYNIAPGDVQGPGPNECFHKYCRQLGGLPANKSIMASIGTNVTSDGLRVSSSEATQLLRYDVDVWVVDAAGHQPWTNVWSVTGQSGGCGEVNDGWTDEISCGTTTPYIPVGSADNIMVCARVTDTSTFNSYPMTIYWGSN
jgi:hypothetical protein